MRFSIRFLLQLGLIFTAQGCSVNSEQNSFAEVDTYYFDIVDSVGTEYSRSIYDSVKIYLEHPYRYYLSENSAAAGWPYYGKASLTEEVITDTLLIPHYSLHELKRREDDQLGKVLRIYLLKVDSSHVWFKESLLRISSNGETILSDPPIDKVKISSYDVSSIIGKSAIRGTFK